MDEAKVELNHDKKRFEVKLGDHIALIDFMIRPAENRIVFLHTEVPKAFSGRGIASRLAKAALEYAKTENLKVTSLCSFIDTYLKRHPEYQELVR